MDAQNGGPGKRNVSCGVRPTPGPPLGRPSPTWLGAKAPGQFCWWRAFPCRWCTLVMRTWMGILATA